MFPGGFSAGDEPDGSGKFIAAVFRNAKLMEAIEVSRMAFMVRIKCRYLSIGNKRSDLFIRRNEAAFPMAYGHTH